MEPQYTILEYLYRDASNYKSWGKLLLSGKPSPTETEAFIGSLEIGNLFVAEQVSIPPLYENLWILSGGKSNDDHAFHEFIGLRPATNSEVSELEVFASVDELLVRFRQAGRCWDCRISPNCAGV
jgi:hypothetical protein